jgi:large subunit ribosomal protein L5
MKKLTDYAVDELTKITGQKRYLHTSLKDVVKLRKGTPIGASCYSRVECMSFQDRPYYSMLPMR